MFDSTAKLHVLRRHVALRAHLLVDAWPYKLRWVEPGREPASASWRFEPAQQQHEILLSESLDRFADKKRALGDFAEQVYCHEVAHSLFTERDAGFVATELRRFGRRVPFGLLNHFEDARIEERWRQLTGERFGWTRWIRVLPSGNALRKALPDISPDHWFHYFISVEGDAGAIARSLDIASECSTVARQRMERVLWYYRRATNPRGPYATETSTLIPLCQHWIREFGRDSSRQRERRRAGGFHGDDYRQFLEENLPPDWMDLETEEELPEQDARRVLIRRMAALRRTGSGKSRDPKPRPFWVDGCNADLFDPKRGDALENALARAFRGGPDARVKSVFPRKRLSVRDYSRGSARIYRGKSHAPSGALRLMLVIDCSGSMRGHPAMGGLTLLQMVSRLHRKRRLQARVFLTNGGSEEVRLPLDERRLMSLSSQGSCEGFEQCFRDHEDAVRWADLLCAYTDGRITDAPIDPGRWRRLNTPSYGLYAGPESAQHAEALKRWFSHSLAANSIEELVTDLVRLVRHGPVRKPGGA